MQHGPPRGTISLKLNATACLTGHSSPADFPSPTMEALSLLMPARSGRLPPSQKREAELWARGVGVWSEAEVGESAVAIPVAHHALDLAIGDVDQRRSFLSHLL